MYSFGLFTTTIFANAGQVVTGNPTPHFLSVCRPNYTALGCPPPSPDRPGHDRFVTDQSACAGSPSLVAAARRAFPCKDAALCAYAVTYTAVRPWGAARGLEGGGGLTRGKSGKEVMPAKWSLKVEATLSCCISALPSSLTTPLLSWTLPFGTPALGVAKKLKALDYG